MDKEYLKADEAAELLGVCRSTVVKLIRDGRLAGIKGLGVYLIRRSDIDKLFEFDKSGARERAKEVAQ